MARYLFNTGNTKTTFGANDKFAVGVDSEGKTYNIEFQYLESQLSIGLTPTFDSVTLNNAAVNNSDAVRLDQVYSLINGLDWQDAVLSKNLSTPPISPTTGDRYIVGASGTGDWLGEDDNITEWDGSDWVFYDVAEGWAVWVKDLDTNYQFNGTSWVEMGSTVSHNNTTGLQGGTSSQYYHLTEAEHTFLIGKTFYYSGNFVAGTDYEVPLTFSTGLDRTGNTITNTDKGSDAVTTHESTFNHTNYNNAYNHTLLTNNPHNVLTTQISDFATGVANNEVDTLQSVTDRGLNTTNQITINSNTVYHAGNSNKIDVDWTTNYINANFANFTNLTSGKIPYDNGSYLVDSPIYTDGVNISIGGNNPSGFFELKKTGEVQLDLNDNNLQIYRIFTRSSDKNFGFYDATNLNTWFRYISDSVISNSILKILENGGFAGIGITPETKLHIADVGSPDNSAYKAIQIVEAENSIEAPTTSYSDSYPSYGITWKREFSSDRRSELGGIYMYGVSGWRSGMLFKVKNVNNQTADPDITAMLIMPSGNILINQTTDSGYKVDVNGAGRFVSDLTANSFIKSGGTSSQFLKADGSVDSSTYLTSAVTSVAAGDGLDFTTITSTGSVTLGTPTTLTSITTNAVTTTSHTHSIEIANQTSDTSTATPTPTGNYKENEYFLTALATDATFAAPSGIPANGNTLLIRIEDNGTSRTLAWNAIYEVVGVTLPTATIISKKIYVGCIYNSTDSKWDVVSVIEEA